VNLVIFTEKPVAALVSNVARLAILWPISKNLAIFFVALATKKRIWPFCTIWPFFLFVTVKLSFH